MYFRSIAYRCPVELNSITPPIFSCQRHKPEDLNPDIVRSINSINILDVLTVDGYCDIIDNMLLTFVLARDVAVGANLIYENNKNYKHKKINATGGVNSDIGIRWDRFTEYFNQAVEEISMANPGLLNYIQPLDTNSYILLEVALGILNKCNNDTAKKFRGQLIYKVVPYIQSQAIRECNMKIVSMSNTINLIQETIDAQGKKLDYQESYLNIDGLFTTTEIAKKFHITAQKLNKVLEKSGYLYSCNSLWFLKAPYDKIGLTTIVDIETKSGIKSITYWTENGRNFVYGVLNSLGFDISKDNTQLVNEYLNS